MSTLSTAHSPLRAGSKNRIRLVAIVRALQPLGLDATPSQVAEALAPLAEGRWGIRIAKGTLDTIVRDHRHQTLINAIISAGFKRLGYEAKYVDFYPAYLEACEKSDINPVGPKTFQNRALRRLASWEKPTLETLGVEVDGK
jgi:hypothetical protein